MISDKDIQEMRKATKDPLNSCEDAADGLEQFASYVTQLLDENERFRLYLGKMEPIGISPMAVSPVPPKHDPMCDGDRWHEVVGGFNVAVDRDSSTISCPCGASLTWTGFDERLDPWRDVHRPHVVVAHAEAFDRGASPPVPPALPSARISTAVRATLIDRMSVAELEVRVEQPVKSERELAAIFQRLAHFAREANDYALGLCFNMLAEDPPEVAAAWRAHLRRLAKRVTQATTPELCAIAAEALAFWVEESTGESTGEAGPFEVGKPGSDVVFTGVSVHPDAPSNRAAPAVAAHLAAAHLAGKPIEGLGQEASIVLETSPNGRLSIMLADKHGEPIATLTTDKGDPAPEEGEIHVEALGDNERAARAALASGLFENTGRRVRAGFVQAQVWRIVPAAPAGSTS